jgi:hypothetical protein
MLVDLFVPRLLVLRCDLFFVYAGKNCLRFLALLVSGLVEVTACGSWSFRWSGSSNCLRFLVHLALGCNYSFGSWAQFLDLQHYS